MSIELDHLILAVNDRGASLDFYRGILGLTYEGESGPFATLRVTPGFVILIDASGTSGVEHLAFALSKPVFDAVFQRVKAGGIAYGDSFDTVGNQKGPGVEPGAKGLAEAVYFFDPNQHLIEIRHYAEA